MTRSQAARLLACTAVVVLTAVTHLIRWRLGGPLYSYWLETTVNGPVVALLAALLIARRPDNIFGRRIFLLTAVGIGLQLVGGQYATTSLARYGGDLPGTVWAAWVSSVAQFAFFGAFLAVIWLFPTGRLPGRRWRSAFTVAFVGLAVLISPVAFGPGEFENVPGISNPLSLQVVRSSGDAVLAVGLITTIAGLVAGLVSLVVRYRGGSALERTQLRWLVYAALAAPCFTFGVGGALPASLMEGTFGSVLWTLVPLSLPAAVALAIARYRLYDIDRIVNRTVVYAAVTLLLGGVYAGIAVLPTTVLELGDSDLLVAGATLAAAAAFRPLRQHIQRFVDRRFYRARYDRERMIESFATRLRDEVDLTSLSDDLAAAVRSSVAPRHVALWVRP